MTFQPGNTVRGSRKGIPNKNAKSVRDVFAEVFHNMQQGKNSLTEWAEKEPTDFYKLASKLLPQTVQSEMNIALRVATGVNPQSDGDCDLC